MKEYIGKGESPTKRGPVPSELARSVCRHERPITESLFQYEHDEGELFKKKIPIEILESYENNFTAPKIEVITAVLFQAARTHKEIGTKKGIAEFKSKYELAELASGNKRKSDKHLKAIDELTEPHQMLDVESDDYVLSNWPPLTISDIKRDDKKLIRIQLSDAIHRDAKFYYHIPLAISLLLRARGGLKRVTTAHVKQYLYIFDRVKSIHHPVFNLDLEYVYEAAGVSHYFAQRRGNRAKKTITAGFEAMVKAKILISFQDLGGSHARIEPNPIHFGKLYKAKSEKKVSNE